MINDSLENAKKIYDKHFNECEICQFSPGEICPIERELWEDYQEWLDDEETEN